MVNYHLYALTGTRSQQSCLLVLYVLGHPRVLLLRTCTLVRQFLIHHAKWQGKRCSRIAVPLSSTIAHLANRISIDRFCLQRMVEVGNVMTGESSVRCCAGKSWDLDEGWKSAI